jgi:hypothetical protein
VRTDPTDNGGLFVGRRPGTAPTKYRALPQRGSATRRRVDALIAHVLVVVMAFISLLFWGPVPAASLWVASRIQYWTGSVSLGILIGFVALLFTLLGGLMVLKRLDTAWILVRRAAGVDQRTGVMPRIFAITAAICAAIFAFWFLVINGPGSSSMPGQGA